MARSTFYYCLSRLSQEDKYAGIKQQIAEINRIHRGRYGHRRITLSLRMAGIRITPKTVLKLMRELDIRCKVRCKRHLSYKGEVGKTAPNLLKRRFHAAMPGRKLVTDVTEFHICGQKVYLSPVLDLYNREILGYAISRQPNMEMVRRMMKQTFPRLPKQGEILLHSDQGCLYQSKAYRSLLQQRGITQSMSRKGNCLDNAVIENFFGILKSELIYLQKFQSLKLFIEELNKYIKYYNNKRIKSKLKGMSPVKYRINYRNK